MSLYSTPRLNGVCLGPYEDDGTANTNHGGYVDFYHRGDPSNGSARIIYWPVDGVPGLQIIANPLYINGENIDTCIRGRTALVLGSNASTGAFAAQTISINYYDCTHIAVIGKVNENNINASTFMQSALVPVSVGAMGFIDLCGIDFWHHARQFTIRQNAIEFTSGFMRSPEGTIYENWEGRSIPMFVLGYKFN